MTPCLTTLVWSPKSQQSIRQDCTVASGVRPLTALSLSLQAANSYLRDQWFHSLQWKVSPCVSTSPSGSVGASWQLSVQCQLRGPPPFPLPVPCCWVPSFWVLSQPGAQLTTLINHTDPSSLPKSPPQACLLIPGQDTQLVSQHPGDTRTSSMEIGCV